MTSQAAHPDSDADHANPTNRLIKPVTAPVITTHATAYVVVFGVVTAATIAITRAYLALTGYPQVGGAVFHLAHALWGGLLLTITTVLLLIVANPWAKWVASVLGGVGAALFVDEVGKFITQKNDYFFPLAATIVYIFLLLLAALAAWLRRITRSTPRAHLYAALEAAPKIVDGALTEAEKDHLDQEIAAVRASTTDPRLLRLADGVAVMLSTVEVTRPDSAIWTNRVRARAVEWERRWLPLGRLRLIGRTLLYIVGFNGLLFVLLFVASSVLRIAPSALMADGNRGSGLTVMTAVAGGIVCIVGGVMAFIAAIAMRRRKPHVNLVARFATISLLLLIVLANGLLAYFDQFMVLTDLVLQAITLAVVGRWVALSERAKQAASAPATSAPMGSSIDGG